MRRDDHGVPRPTCPACGFIAYRNPSPAVAAVVPYQDGIVLVRRRYEPYAGSWSLPSGFMEWGEDPAGTARRETLEETGLEVEIVDLIGAYAGRDDPRTRVVLLVYRARVLGGRMRAGDDADDIAAFPRNALPENLAFRAHRLALRDDARRLARENRRASRTTARADRVDSHDAKGLRRASPRSRSRT